MNTYTVSFFGHREVEKPSEIEERLDNLLYDLITQKEYVEFLIGRDGEFDQIVASTVRRAKRDIREDNSELIWVMAYPKAEYANSADSFDDYYDRVEVCDEAAKSHPKAAIQVRNRCMVDRSDLVVCFVDHANGGAYQTMKYAEKTGRPVINFGEKKND